MTALETRGGFPFVTRRAIPIGASDPQQVVQSPGHIKFLQISNEGGNIVRVYFSEADYTADANYIELEATTGYFEGPVELRGNNLYLRAQTAASDPVVVVFYLRR